MNVVKVVAVAAVACALGEGRCGEFVEMKNPGFDAIEDGKAVGWSNAAPVWRFERGAGLNGSGGCVYESKVGSPTPRPSQKVKLVPGRKYKVSALVKARDLKVDRPGSPGQGVTVLLSWFDKNGKWMGECQASPAVKSGDEWREISATSRDIPEGVAYGTVEPYVNGHGIGCAAVDQIVLQAVSMDPVENVVSSAYRNESTGGKVRFAAVVNWVELADPQGAKGYFQYVGKGGRAVVKEATRTRCGAVADLDVDDFAMGTNDVSFVLKSGEKTVAKASTSFARLRELPKRRARIDEKMRLIVDGKPFFPLGMYTAGMDTNKIARYVRSPFNCVGPYDSMGKEKLDLYDSYGIKVLYSLCYAPEREKSYFPRLRQKVREFAADHPAVIGWYICDEPTLNRLPGLLAWRKEIEELDGGQHPIWGCLAQFSDTRHFIKVYDVLGIDPYPVPSPVAAVTKASREANDGMFGTQAMWNIPQAFAWGWLNRRETKGKRAPTKVELANMTWQMIAGGANGIVYYSYSQMKDTYEDIDDRADCYFEKVCSAAAEVRAYERVLLSGGDAPAAKSSSGDVVCRTWRDDGGRTYLLVVNTREAQASAKISLSEKFARIETAEFASKPSLDGDVVSCELPPLAYMMLRLGK